MAFSALILKEMFMKSTFFLILIYLIIIKVTYGYLGCANNLVPCLNATHCIKIEQVCVDYHDCVDKENNKICHYCPPGDSNTIACVTHIESELIYECLSPHQICNGKKDCINNEDEHLCGIRKCKLGLWLCANGTCIEKSQICDTYKDCPDGSDEGNICHSILCEPNEIRCPTGECILKSKMCDNIPHCSDGYDEKNCLHLTSTPINDSCSILSNTFSCSPSLTFIHRICISNDRVCDGYKDCPMGDDERECTNECTPKSTCIANSGVNCIQHPSVGQLCRCIKQGYRLTTNSPQICQDFDECNDSLGIYCSFNCLNTNNSFNCTCPTDFTIDEQTKTCRKINDLSKPNLLILFDDNIILYNIRNTTDQYSLKLLNTINIEKNHHFDHIQYDPNQMFVIYYDQIQHAILCKSIITLKTLILLSNITIHNFAYNANEKILFIIENQSQTLRMYTPITCNILYQIKMHSWSLINISNSIQSIDIDVYNRQIIFASNYQFMISNMSEPNITKIIYTTDREIKRFIYDASFKRIFWTAINVTNNESFPVYTCDRKFKQCHDTSIRLPSAWPFAFFNDGLLYTPVLLTSLDFIQLYGKHRFLDGFITSTRENIRSFLLIDHQQNELSNLCMNHSIIHCKDKLCLQINSTNINCLSIDEKFIPKEIIQSTTDIINSILQSAIQPLVDDDDLASQTANQHKNHPYRPSNTMLFVILTTGIAVTALAFFVKRCHKRLNQKVLDNEQHQNERCLATDEPHLDEFNVIVDDRVSKNRADYARDILIENPSILLLGRRRESV